MGDFISALPREIHYVGLLFALFILPRFLQRFRIPTPITAITLGVIAGLGFHEFHDDSTVQLLASFGIVSLFLFAGMDIDFAEIRIESKIIGQNIVLLVLTVGLVGYLLLHWTELEFRTAMLAALALLTPSTGFILESLQGFETTKSEIFWIRSLAIGTELAALLLMFFLVQSESIRVFAISLVVLTGLIVVLPLIFRFFAKFVVPYAPKSEFAFLLMVALVSAYVTRQLGVYYLVGAFVVGVVAQRFRQRLPAFATNQMLHAVEVFASFFVPFYFFSAGLHLDETVLSWQALGWAALFLIVLIPLRLALIALHRRWKLREPIRASFRIGAAIMPTLVFALVITEIIRVKFAVSSPIIGGIVWYTLLNTLLPAFVFKLPTPELDVSTPDQIGETIERPT